MQIETPAAPAGAQTDTETVSAERVAADAGDVNAFLEASRDRRAGKPPAKVTRPREVVVDPLVGEEARPAAAVVAGRDGHPAKGPKPEDRAADERLTARIRDAVDTATAESTRRIQELEAQVAAARQPARPTERTGSDGAAAAKPAERKGPLTKVEIAAYQALPGAPKLDDKNAAGEFLYDTSQEHAVALSEFIRETRTAEAATETRTRTEHVERVKREEARVSTFQDRVEAFKRENAAILVDNGKGIKAVPLSPEVGALHGYGQLAKANATRQAQGLAPLPATVDHAIAEELYDSEIPMECARFLTEHPEELATLRTATAPAQLTRMFGGLEARVRAAAPAKTAPAAGAGAKPNKSTIAESRREAEAAVDRSVSSARPLDGTLGRAGAGGEADPEAVAVQKQDVGSFLDVQRQRRQEILNGRIGARR